MRERIHLLANSLDGRLVSLALGSISASSTANLIERSRKSWRISFMKATDQDGAASMITIKIRLA